MPDRLVHVSAGWAPMMHRHAEPRPIPVYTSSLHSSPDHTSDLQTSPVHTSRYHTSYCHTTRHHHQHQQCSGQLPRNGLRNNNMSCDGSKHGFATIDCFANSTFGRRSIIMASIIENRFNLL